MPNQNERRSDGPPAANESQYQDIADKLITVSVIAERDVVRYQKAATKSGFEMEIVALEGEYYLRGVAVNVFHATEDAHTLDEFRRILLIRPVVSEIPVPAGKVAVSIKRPVNEPDHSVFLRTLEKQE